MHPALASGLATCSVTLPGGPKREPEWRLGPSAAWFDNLARDMPDVFWIGLTLAVAIFLIGVISGARSRTTSLRTGAAMGAYMGIMLAFPLLALGLANS